MSASFEHSAMKSSFSLSSLGSAPAPPGGRCEQLERPYHSLTKKRKEPHREAWRRSWGSAHSGGSGDDLWPRLQRHYDYIMDNQLIDTCKEANCELSAAPLPPAPVTSSRSVTRRWGAVSQLIDEFDDLCQWITRAQEEIYSSPENLSSRKLRVSHMTEMVKAEPRRDRFYEQARAVVESVPEASAEVSWRVDHLKAKWEGLRLLLNPEQQQKEGDIVDAEHELRCLRRWLHAMEGRVPPPSLAAGRAPGAELARRLQEFQVLQRDVECHGPIVRAVLRLCGEDAGAAALHRRWQHLYLRVIEWQCHLETCLSRGDEQTANQPEEASDSDEEPAFKQPRLSRGSPRRPAPRAPAPRALAPRRRRRSVDSRQSASEEEQEYEVTYNWRGSSDSETESQQSRDSKMADVHKMAEAHKMADERLVPTCDGLLEKPTDQMVPAGDDVDGSTRSPKTPPTVVKRKKPVNTSKFNQSDRKSKHLATFYFRHHDTDSDRPVVDERSQESSEESEEWTYVVTKSTDVMTSSVEIQCELTADPKLPATPDLIRDQRMDIERLVMQAEEFVQRQAHAQMSRKKGRGKVEEGAAAAAGAASRAKMSRIKEWLNQSKEKVDSNQGAESYDASGEYTTESEVDASVASEGRTLHSSMDMSASTCTVTPTHQPKVQLRKKRATPPSSRPWSVSCLTQLGGGRPASRPAALSISESALHTLAAAPAAPLRAALQGHTSSATMTEACASCAEGGGGGGGGGGEGARRRRRQRRAPRPRSHCGGSPAPRDRDRAHRGAASDPAVSAKHRFDTTSTSGNDSDEDRHHLATVAHLRRSIERTHITDAATIPEQSEPPSFKLGPIAGRVRPRSMERERTMLAMCLGNPSELWDLSVDKDSDVDKSVNTGTEEHSSFSEQAWDFYQEKYNSENYSEAPDSDAARRLLEFGDDYRAFLDSQSDCCSSLSAQGVTRRRPRPSDTPPRKPKRSMSSAERKKSLLDNLERSRHREARERDSLRRNSSDEVNSSLEYTEVNNRPDILDSLSRRRESELQKVALTELRRRSEPRDSGDDSSSPKRQRETGVRGGPRALLRRSAAQLEAAEAVLERQDSEPDLLRAFDYTDILARCRENITLLEAAMSESSLSLQLQRDIKAVSSRWSALRAAAARRGGARRLRRELAALREAVLELSEPGDAAPQPHTRAQLHRRCEELKERLARLLECKVSLLKLTVTARRTLGESETDDCGVSAELAAALGAWEDAHRRTSSELLSLEKAISAWTEWETALRELQTALRGDLATLQDLKTRGADEQTGDQGSLAAQIRMLAASLVDKKGSSCDSLSDSGISDGDSEGAGRARRLGALRELARRLQDALAPNSPAHRAITKRMEATEHEVRSLQESCRALVRARAPDLQLAFDGDRGLAVTKTGAGDPDYVPRGGWLWRVLRSSIPIQLCLVALLLAAWLVERPRCCDALNSLVQSLTPQLRYVRGPPPV